MYVADLAARALRPGQREAAAQLWPGIFDHHLFRRHADIAVARLEEYLADTSVRGLDMQDPAKLLGTARRLMADGRADEEKLAAIIDLYVRTGIQVHSPGYMGRQFSGVVPLAGVMDFVSSVVNQPSAFYEAGPLPSVAERLMAEEFGRFIGWRPGSFAMVTTSGGSLATLTALLAARNDRLPGSWSEGVAAAGALRPAIAIGADTHYSAARAAGILGIGEDHLVRLPLDGERRVDPVRAAAVLDEARARGLDVFAMVISAGTTAIGAFDPIGALAELAAERGIWLHVDGAHGGALLVSDRLRHRLAGVEKADSFVLDAHKTLFVPSMCTLLFYRDKAKSTGAFRQEASYVFEKEPDIYTEFDSAEMSFECTKRPMIMPLWTLWALHGRAPFADKLEYLCDLAGEAYEILGEQPDFEAIHRPEANILCFRHRPAGVALPPDFQVRLRNRIREEGTFFISKVDIDASPALRVVFMNHRTEPEHFRMLLREIRRAGQDILSQREDN